jgi:DNA-binding XRE family transcriptional regulator
MMPAELKAARTELALTQTEFGIGFDVTQRTVSGWEAGQRDGKPCPIPRPIAVLIRLALRSSTVRRELALLALGASRPPLLSVGWVGVSR